MLYYRKEMLVDAMLVTRGMTVEGKTGQPGQYFVQFADGSFNFMSPEVFEANFENAAEHGMIATTAAPTPKSPPVPEPEPIQLTQYVCLGCGSEVAEEIFEKKTGLCVDCLKQTVTCQTCGQSVKQYEVIGTYCRKCLASK